MKITRVITYEGPAEILRDQLGRSLPDGLKIGNSGITIDIITVGNITMLDMYQKCEEIEDLQELASVKVRK